MNQLAIAVGEKNLKSQRRETMNPIIYYESMDQLGGSAVQANLGSACS